MRTVGIIAEYNPFHTGHAYHIRQAKKQSGADCVIAVMSPDFVQRGDPALFDKYTRARMALMNGADLVVELPVCYAAGSAEYFARGAVALLDGLGAADTLCFGAESEDEALFRKTAEALQEESEEFVSGLRSLLRQGKTFPQARAEALRAQLERREAFPAGADASASADFLSGPNNILGIEYCRALLSLGSQIRPLPIPRKGSGHLSPALKGPHCSAAALRRAVLEKPDEEDFLRFVPENCRELFLSARRLALTSEDLLPFLVQKLLSQDQYDDCLDLPPSLSNRIRRERFACIGKTYAETVAHLRTKQFTEARVRRALLHLILGLKTEEVESFRADRTVYYARILGFRREASDLLHALRKTSSLPLITRPALAARLPEGHARQMWKQDVFASHLYRSIRAGRFHERFLTEYEISPVIL